MKGPVGNRQLLRAALALEREYRKIREPTTVDVGFLEVDVKTIRRLERRLKLATERSYRFATIQSQKQIERAMERLINSASHCRDQINKGLMQKRSPSLRTLYDELSSLSDEFESIDIFLDEKRICVQTDHVVLEEVNLGGFEITLQWTKLGEDQPYRIEALDPNPSLGGDGTVHPHVQNGSLCEGEGKPAIRKSLMDGRICDFFLLIHQVLQTYNSDSAYVALEDWNGVPCVACEDFSSQEESSQCVHCGSSICHHCVGSCSDCLETVCSECVEHCAACDDRLCNRCLQSCQECGATHCDSCLENNLCLNCKEELDAESENTPIDPTPSSASSPETSAQKSEPDEAHTSLHTVRVVETDIPA